MIYCTALTGGVVAYSYRLHPPQFPCKPRRDLLPRVPVHARRGGRADGRRQQEAPGRAGHRRACGLRAGPHGGGHPLALLDGEQDGEAAAVQGRRHPPETRAGLRHAPALLLQATQLPAEQQGTASLRRLLIN